MAEAPLRLLLIEDDEDDYLLTRELLREIPGRDFRLEWAVSAEAGRGALRRGGFDVCLIDYRLGGETGLELLREAVAGGVRAPVILLTGQGDQAVDVEAMHAGAADYLVKGQTDAAGLERSIRYAIERQRDREELRRARDELEDRVRERTAALEAEVAARAHLEEELRRHAEELAEAHRRKDEFLAMLGHELRNPLGPLRHAVQILKLRGGDPATIAWLRDLLDRQVNHLSRLVDDLLDASRIVQGKIRLQMGQVDLREVTRTTAEDHRATIEKAGVELKLELPPGPVWVRGDPVRLAQVTSNLLANAAKFTDPGGHITVRLGPHHGNGSPADDGRAALTVADTGVGIEPELLPRLFDKFAQSDRSLSRNKAGLGLGLALVRGLVRMHGGTVTAHSDGPGKGAEFTCVYPLSSGPAAAGPGEKSASAGRPHRILIVEDNRDTADTLRFLLEHAGHEVAVAYTGPDGIAEAKRFRPEVMLCDLDLPGVKGFQVARALRADPATASARMIAVSGYGQDEDQARAKEAGFDELLIKPVDPEALLEVLAAKT